MRFLLKILLILCLSSCASLPREAPMLSQELGNQLRELESSHINLVHVFFEGERREVHEFINEEWLPLFVVNFLEQPQINRVWEEVMQSGSEEGRHQFIVHTTPILQQQINHKYQELVIPLNRLEHKLVLALRNKYSNAYSINSALTSFLYSASEVGENRQRYLDMIGITEEETNANINKVAAFTDSLLEPPETIQELEEKISTYKKELNELLSKF